jgi:Zn-dependent protease
LLRRTEPGARRSAGGTTAAVGLGATIIAALSKVGLLIKFALPLMSALASFGIYAALYGWQFGLGIVGLLFVHEMGHFVVIRAKGLPASLPVFVPLLGAYVALRQLPRNALDGAEIAIAGPVTGALGGLACYAIYEQTGARIWLALAFFSFLINLLNLIPVSPLDGGRIVGAISKWIWPIGLGVVVLAFFYTHSILLLIVGWLGLVQMVSQFRAGARLDSYYRVSLAARIWVAVLYFGLTAALAVATFQTQGMLVIGGGLFGQ